MNPKKSLLDIYIEQIKKKEKEKKRYDGVERNRELEKKQLPTTKKKKKPIKMDKKILVNKSKIMGGY